MQEDIDGVKYVMSLSTSIALIRDAIAEAVSGRLFKYGPNSQPGRATYGGKTYIYRHPAGDLVGTIGERGSPNTGGVELAFVFHTRGDVNWMVFQYLPMGDEWNLPEAQWAAAIERMKADGESIARELQDIEQPSSIVEKLEKHGFQKRQA